MFIVDFFLSNGVEIDFVSYNEINIEVLRKLFDILSVYDTKLKQ